MGFIIKKFDSNLVDFSTVVPSADILTCGSIPVSLNIAPFTNFLNKWFQPMMALMQNVNGTIPYNFNANAHPIIYNASNPLFVQFGTFNIMNQGSLYVNNFYQRTHSYSGVNLTGAAGGNNFNGLFLSTYNSTDATNGNGDIEIKIVGTYINP